MNGAIILAAGRGRRMKADRNKQYLSLSGHAVLFYSLLTFAQAKQIDGVILVVHPDEYAQAQALAQEAGLLPKLEAIVEGGAERQDSVRLALAAVPTNWQQVVIHDGARPLVSEGLINRVLSAMRPGCGVIPGVALRDTIKKIDDKSMVRQTVPRHELVAVQTPQGFYVEEIRHLHDKAYAEGVQVTDDAALFESYGYGVQVIPGEIRNLKITVPEDLVVAAQYLTMKE